MQSRDHSSSLSLGPQDPSSLLSAQGPPLLELQVQACLHLGVPGKAPAWWLELRREPDPFLRSPRNDSTEPVGVGECGALSPRSLRLEDHRAFKASLKYTARPHSSSGAWDWVRWFHRLTLHKHRSNENAVLSTTNSGFLLCPLNCYIS